MRIFSSKPLKKLQVRMRLPEVPMTIGIGVLCSSKPRPYEPRPDTVVLMADTMGSTQTDSTDQLHKLLVDDKQQVYAVCAGKVEYAGELFPMIAAELSALKRRTHGEIWHALNRVAHELRRTHFGWDVIAKRYGFAGPPGHVSVDHLNAITQEWQQYDLNSPMIVGTFAEDKTAMLYLIGQFVDEYGAPSPGMVHLCQFPGFNTIGTGSPNADFWLKVRGQQLGNSPRQSLYHAYEAKIMATNAPTVNKHLELVVATAEGSYILTDEKPDSPNADASITELEHMFKKYGPQSTLEIGHKPKPSASQMSAGQR